MTTVRKYRVLYPFGGIAGGALGFSRARATVLGVEAFFESMGSIDNDPAACRDFEYFTDSPAWCRDVATITPEEMRNRYGDTAPDCVFLSAPCKSFSALLAKRLASTKKYVDMSRLGELMIELLLATWPDSPPRLVLFENVERIASAGRGGRAMLRRIRSRLAAAGYVSHGSTHECGELGGLAQIRRRYLLVARHQKSVPTLLYQPPKRRVRACGEVLGELPMPEDPSAGPLHTMPRISWLNWVRLSLIPAGGDWRDLPDTLVDGQARREKWKRHKVEEWQEATGTVGGSGSNGVVNVADPRASWFRGTVGILGWTEPSGTVTGGAAVSRGSFAVSDPRICALSDNPNRHWNKYRVEDWGAPARAVIGATRPGSGAPAVADPRVAARIAWEREGKKTPGETHWFKGKYGVGSWDYPSRAVIGGPSNGIGAVADPRFANIDRVLAWEAPATTVTGARRPGSGAPSVADPRVKTGYDHAYGVRGWADPSFTIAAGTAVGQGAYSVADHRLPWLEAWATVGDVSLGCAPRSGAYGVISWLEAASTIAGAACIDNGPFAVGDPRAPDTHAALVDDATRSPYLLAIDPKSTKKRMRTKRVEVPVVIIAADGTWHRPLTTLELAVLQGFPAIHKGAPLKLDGDNVSEWRMRIGNAVPVGTAEAIARQMLLTLLHADLGAFALSGDGAVWVEPPSAGVAS